MISEQMLLAVDAMFQAVDPEHRKLRCSLHTLRKLLPKECKAAACLMHFFIVKELACPEWSEPLELVQCDLENHIDLVALSVQADFRQCYPILSMDAVSSYKAYSDLLMQEIAPLAAEASGSPDDLSFCFTFKGKVCCTEEALLKRLQREQACSVA
ncbi:MAG: hypothetical protein JW739_04290 [Opitutales bacterium]|nr:hypothetical protein [Opitutales bacterium]